MLITLLAFTVSTSLTSCATIFSGTKQTVSFNSNPPDADVVTVMKNGSELTIGRTPCTVEIHKKTKDVKFVKQKYYTETYNLSKNISINPWLWADIASIVFLGTGLIPTAVDLIDGAWMTLPQQVKVELKEK